ncbi:MAG TPA: transcriptional regulator [Kofleriaceae bacterium]|jgi:hypothetical protein|nr:transcriptional regulator [Kofleriaceae bacterium]
MSRNKISTTVYTTPEHDTQRKVLHHRPEVPVAAGIRLGGDRVVPNDRDQLPGQVDLHLGSR